MKLRAVKELTIGVLMPSLINDLLYVLIVISQLEFFGNYLFNVQLILPISMLLMCIIFYYPNTLIKAGIFKQEYKLSNSITYSTSENSKTYEIQASKDTVTITEKKGVAVPEWFAKLIIYGIKLIINAALLGIVGVIKYFVSLFKIVKNEEYATSLNANWEKLKNKKILHILTIIGFLILGVCIAIAVMFL